MNYLLSVSPPLKPKLHDIVVFVRNLKLLDQCLAHSRCPVNICRMNRSRADTQKKHVHPDPKQKECTGAVRLCIALRL